MAGRIDLGGGKSGGAPASGGGGMPNSEKLKLVIALVTFLIGGVGMAFYFGAFDSLNNEKLPPGTATLDGKPIPPEQVEEFKAKQREYQEAIQKETEKSGPPAGS